MQRALEWLKTNNPLFANVTISVARLAELPENDVPYKLLATAKLSTNINQLHAEHNDYVPSQNICDKDGVEGNICLIIEGLYFIKTAQLQTQSKMTIQIWRWIQCQQSRQS